ncbi:MAG: WhiB family transcriptional regulator [Streptomyces sp.]|nr:WhiB family transcriptional regulator [Streptomyces sp.]
MNHYSGSIPNTLNHGREWLQHAVCKADPDAMHPGNDESGIAYAKRIWAACPVRMVCLQDALRTGDNDHGIRGALKPSERRAVAQRLNPDQYTNADAVTDAVQAVLHPATAERTLRDLWEERAYELPGGHLGWRGDAGALSFQGRAYTPKRIAFLLHRGYDPVGIVRRTCPVVECVHPLHVADNRERWQQQQTEPGKPEQVAAQGGRKLAECGTTSAYQRHVRNKEFIDDACRAANAAAQARYARTGSTKAVG